MNDQGKLLKIYFDARPFGPCPEVDDFLIAVGEKRSNRVYHIAEVRKTYNQQKRMNRFYLKVYRSDLLTALNRNKMLQEIIIIKGYARNKKI